MIKIGAKVTRHATYVLIQLAEVVLMRNLFAAILDRIARLALPPPLVTGRDSGVDQIVRNGIPEGEGLRGHRVYCWKTPGWHLFLAHRTARAGGEQE